MESFVEIRRRENFLVKSRFLIRLDRLDKSARSAHNAWDSRSRDYEWADGPLAYIFSSTRVCHSSGIWDRPMRNESSSSSLSHLYSLFILFLFIRRLLLSSSFLLFSVVYRISQSKRTTKIRRLND